ncbi:homeobox protein 2 [Biomphalaria glabrata]|nr:homeobox protein 2 [Biomphalaria glabrata]
MGDEGLIQDRLGKMVDVYDGRKWPVVKVASIYIHPVDNVHKLTQAVLSDPSVGKKRWRTNKYTLAVGTTHGHVQVFLSENDFVLNVFQQCTAEEKCLLLIKKPKDASKKLLKSQSLNNLSMSDTQLYKPKHDLFSALFTSNKTKGSLSTISETEKSKKKGTKKAQVNTFVPIPELGIYTPEQHVLKNGTYAQYCHLVREVNNNNAKNYENLSNVDLALSSSFSSTLDDSFSSYGFGQGETTQLVNSANRHHKLDEAYHSCIDLSHDNLGIKPLPPKPPREHSRSYMKQVKEEQNNLDPTTRSHSLGDLTTGLTFSLVGDHKLQHIWSDTDDNCWNRNNKNISKHNMAPPKDSSTGGSTPHKSIVVNEKNYVPKMSNKDQYITEVGETKGPYRQEKFPFQRQNSAPEVIKPQLSVFQAQIRMETEQPDIRFRAMKSRPDKESQREQEMEHSVDSKAPVIRQPLLNNWQNNNPNQAVYSKNNVREQSPLKPKRSLPVVPAADTSERVKRLTEVMKSRIASSNSRSNSQGRLTSDSTQTVSVRSYSENSDGDVFTDVPTQYYTASDRIHYSDSAVVHSSPKSNLRSAVSVGNGHADFKPFKSYDRITNSDFFPQSSSTRREGVAENIFYDDCSYLDHQSVPQADRSSDSTTITNPSHNGSIMDSGYTTNNESDSFNQAARVQYSQSHHNSQQSSCSPHHNVVSQHSPVLLVPNAETHSKCYQIHNAQIKKQSNLVYSRQFGSVQNISSSLAHGSLQEPFKTPHVNSSQQDSTMQSNTHHPAVKKIESRRLTLDGSYYPSYNSSKQSFSASNGDGDNKKTYVNIQNIHTSNGNVRKTIDQFRSVEPMYSTINSNRHYANTSLVNAQKENSTLKYRTNDYESDYVNQTPLKPQGNRNKPSYNQNTNNKSTTDSSDVKNSHSDYHNGDAYLYRKTQYKQDSSPKLMGNELRPKPVPIAGRPLRGHTLPGGFRFSDLDGNLSQGTHFSRDLSLFHLLQAYELLPFTVNVPESLSVSAMIQLKEISTRQYVSSTPESPKGRTAHIGSPGSAFTPVKIVHDRTEQSLSSKLIGVDQVNGELHKHIVLGSLEEGDIIVEVNGFLCLDANAQYMEKLLRSCSGCVTFTVARLREAQDGVVPVDSRAQAQRIKSLEAEISRLDDLIQLRDEKIRDLISWRGGTGSYTRGGAVMDISAAMEGMVIGDDEYVV